MILLGIDPGVNGGFASRNGNGDIFTGPLPDTDGDILQLLEMISLGKCNEKICYLENIVKFTGSPMPSSAMASYASSWGVLKGILMALKFQLVLVTPQTWQKAVGVGTSKGLTKTEWKNKLKAEAQRLYPRSRITLANSDAALIFRYAELQERSK